MPLIDEPEHDTARQSFNTTAFGGHSQSLLVGESPQETPTCISKLRSSNLCAFPQSSLPVPTRYKQEYVVHHAYSVARQGAKIRETLH
ncbi:hypothetical protein WAI453_003658 [Rhynchosporium graminicola]